MQIHVLEGPDANLVLLPLQVKQLFLVPPSQVLQGSTQRSHYGGVNDVLPKNPLSQGLTQVPLD